MIMRMHARVLAATSPQNLTGAIRQYLVHVHVKGDTGTGIEDVHDEVIVEPPGQRLIGRHHDRARDRLLQKPQLGIDLSRALLDPHDRPNQLRERTPSADGVILHGPHRLDPIIRLGRNRPLPKAISLNPLHGAHLPEH